MIRIPDRILALTWSQIPEEEKKAMALELWEAWRWKWPRRVKQFPEYTEEMKVHFTKRVKWQHVRLRTRWKYYRQLAGEREVANS